METVAHPYFGVFFLFIFTFVAFSATVKLSSFVGKTLARRDNEKLKLSPYECGPETSRQPNAISPQFYLYALIFILFDVEIIFMFPWAVNFQVLGWLGFIGIFVFILILAIGFIYEWGKGALEWQSMK